MADKEKYMINIQGKMIEVSEDVYYAYFRMERQERWQEEKQQEHGVVSYDALDNGEMVGAEIVADPDAPSLEDLAIAKELNNRLHHAIAALPRADRELIQAIYYEGMTEREYPTVQKADRGDLSCDDSTGVDSPVLKRAARRDPRRGESPVMRVPDAVSVSALERHLPFRAWGSSVRNTGDINSNQISEGAALLFIQQGGFSHTGV